MQTVNQERASQAQDSPAEPTAATTTTAVGPADKDPFAQLVNTSDKGPDAGLVSRLVSADDIRACAFKRWESEGKPAGDSIRFWLEAEQEVARANSQS